MTRIAACRCTRVSETGQVSFQPTRSHVVAGLTALLFGVLGIHKFYLGYFGTGFVMLATSIVGGIISFGIAPSVVWLVGIIEGAIYLTMPQISFDETYIHRKKEWF